jgi:hypothetical protein
LIAHRGPVDGHGLATGQRLFGNPGFVAERELTAA